MIYDCRCYFVDKDSQCEDMASRIQRALDGPKPKTHHTLNFRSLVVKQ